MLVKQAEETAGETDSSQQKRAVPALVFVMTTARCRGEEQSLSRSAIPVCGRGFATDTTE